MSLRVAIVTQDEPFHMAEFFEAFFENLTSDVEIDSVTILSFLNDSTWELANRMYGLYGPKNFAMRGIDYVYRKIASKVSNSYSVENVVNRKGIPIRKRESVNQPDFVSYLENFDIDVLLSASAPEIFDSDVLEAPKWGCLNVHTASLPEYRGMLPTFWALYHGEDEIGVTVHTMVEDIDKGEIVRQTSFPVADDDTLDDVINRGKQIGGYLAAQALADIKTNNVTLTPMEGEGSYFSFPKAKERKEFQRRGGELL